MYIFTINDEITATNFGGKASWLKWLYDNHVAIPNSLFIPVHTYEEIISLISNQSFVDELKRKLATINCSRGLAIRSSSLSEDGAKESKAGNFSSYLNVNGIENILASIVKVVKSNVNNEIDKMGVIIQSMVLSGISGVLFSSNPISASKKEMQISAIYGLGEALVSGQKDSIDICAVLEEDQWIIEDNKLDISLNEWNNFLNLVKKLENHLNYPIDIEWCYELLTHTFTIVQCRPITTIFVENKLVKISNDTISDIPFKYINSDKVKLRLFAENQKVKISDGYLVVCNCLDDNIPLQELNITRSKDYRGYSVVILYPSKIEQKVIRSFIGDKYNVEHVIKCQRYGIRSLPDYDNLMECLKRFYRLARNETWVCTFIIQEIYDPLYTGIVKKIDNGYVLEFAKGHFVSKGVVPMTTYVLNRNGDAIVKNEIRQYRHIGIIEGCTLECGCADEESATVSLSDKAVKDLINSFKKILDEKGVTVEFGILKNDENYTPYLIDCVKEEREDAFNYESFVGGVISEGAIRGRIKKIDIGNLDETLNFHFYNELSCSEYNSDEKLIFYADLPSIKFIELLSKYSADKIGFVFKQGSLLCHFSVLLRERRIPAIVGIDGEGLSEGDIYLLDTSSRNKLIKI